jgi:UDP-N-acetylglucosamine 4,6-dehydratase/5-epimerase
LITGGTGSFGNTMVRSVLDKGWSEIRIFSRDEKKQDEMRGELNNPLIRYIVGDVRNAVSVNDAMEGVNFVFHAAALKQVPSCEFYPMEAIETNILGANNVMRAAMHHNVDRCVVLSTDKAVYPINSMGMTKALMEKTMQAMARRFTNRETRLCATRYGNVMASRGSVIPLFIDQIVQGKRITITDPGMTRFLMSLQDSVELVLYAFNNARPGDLFVQKSPAATVVDLAQALIELIGQDPGIDIIGIRHGEKLFETLVSREEMARADDLGTYYRIPADVRDLNYHMKDRGTGPAGTTSDEYNSDNTKRLSVGEIKDLLLATEDTRQHVEEAIDRINRKRA